MTLFERFAVQCKSCETATQTCCAMWQQKMIHLWFRVVCPEDAPVRGVKADLECCMFVALALHLHIAWRL